MPHVWWHTWCGGAGDFVQEKLLKFRQHSALGVGVALKPEGFAEFGVEEKEIEQLRKMIERDIHKWYERCRKLGVPVHYYPPFPENMPEH